MGVVYIYHMIIVADTRKRKCGLDVRHAYTVPWLTGACKRQDVYWEFGELPMYTTQRRLHFCIVTCFARGAAPCVCALVHQCGRDSIGFDPLQPELAAVRINPDRSADTA